MGWQEPALTSEDFGDLSTMASFLQQFERITNVGQGVHVLASQQVLLARDLIRLTEDEDDDPKLVKVMKREMRRH